MIIFNSIDERVFSPVLPTTLLHQHDVEDEPKLVMWGTWDWIVDKGVGKCPTSMVFFLEDRKKKNKSKNKLYYHHIIVHNQYPCYVFISRHSSFNYMYNYNNTPLTLFISSTLPNENNLAFKVTKNINSLQRTIFWLTCKY